VSYLVAIVCAVEAGGSLQSVSCSVVMCIGDITSIVVLRNAGLLRVTLLVCFKRLLFLSIYLTWMSLFLSWNWLILNAFSRIKWFFSVAYRVLLSVL